ncbi:oxygen-independent coproporphyrinogen III oxidase [Propylenella binzhouense]|uniref:Coproporphyrinogen-III oxidase n=1 Tax=Propylenella binzhouense TaxID=2555902 RepID=A0A964T6J5_9HYPH|nr:oxygen-independent coproporphyrinogen III oxidase [Propylenella binzhouense]MYZ48749.1 oxygen-independent coproporphyrinogen III oxidase [Propylenella binzhouense]
MEKDVIRRHAAPVPRYTSYPTAPHFTERVDAATYRSWLGRLPRDARLSLYCHIPFCDTLCWFCGCHTKETRQYAPVAAYAGALAAEIRTVGGLLPEGPEVRQVHWGGGSPTILSAGDIARLAGALREAFRFAGDAEFSIEVDPRMLDEARIEALADAGVTRASFGVQDFDPEVQKAINRVQTYEETEAVVEAFRARGVRSLNIDVLYGLPRQTRDAVEHTVRKVVALRPDRIALFGYAHVPWMKKHQTMIHAEELPDVVERFAQANRAASILVASGYERIGMDHFALPGDSLAVAAREGRLHRNFQGYTADAYDALIGLGASAIGQLPQGYVQNEVATGRYRARVEAGELAVVRGFELSAEDRIRAYAIERLMCEFRLSRNDLAARFGDEAEEVLEEAAYLAQRDEDGFLAEEGDAIAVTPRGRPFVRTICAALDPYFMAGAARHSVAV